MLADRYLCTEGTRLAHSATVAQHVERAADLAPNAWRSALMDAAWLHDIGYSPRVARTGFHPLDAARWLRDRDWRAKTCRLVAWHGEAAVEARLRGLDRQLRREFEPPPPLPAAILRWADLTSSPSGETCTVDERLSDILTRYPPDSLVHRAVLEASPAIRIETDEIEARLATEEGRT
jgi:hypothetical protein